MKELLGRLGKIGVSMALNASLFALSQVALAQPKPALVQSVDEPGRQPYIFLISSIGPVFSSPVVPAGKRVILQYATFSANTANGVLSINVATGGGNYFIPFVPTSGGGGAISAPITGFLDAGQHMNVNAVGPLGPLGTSFLGTITGYVIDCNATSPCTAPAP